MTNRTDELTERLIDGILTESEAAELELLLSNPAECDRYVALLELEAALRGGRKDLNFGPPVVARIEGERTERTVEAVMTRIGTRPRHYRRLRQAAAAAVVAAAIFVAVWRIFPGSNLETPPENTPAATVISFAQLTVLSGQVELIGPDGTVVTPGEESIRSGHTVRTVGEESTAVLVFPGAGRVDVHPDTSLILEEASGGGSVFLEQGWVTAVATDEPTQVGTGPAKVEARNGTFTLWSAGPESARIEPVSGDIRILRGRFPESVHLEPGQAVFVRNRDVEVKIEAPLPRETTPLHRLDFPGVRDVCLDREVVWAASAKQWLRWRPGAPAERTLFLTPAANDGITAVFSADHHSLFAVRSHDHPEQITIRDLPSGEVRLSIPVEVAESRLLAVSPDARWFAVIEKRPARTVRVFDAITGVERFIRRFERDNFCAAATPDNRHLAVDVSDLGHGKNNRVEFLDANTGQTAFTLPTGRRQVTALAFVQDGSVMAAGFNGAVQLWNVPQRTRLRILDGFERVVTSLVFSPDGKRIAAGTQDGQIWIWSCQSGRRLQIIDAGNRSVRSMTFSPDGTRLVTGTSTAGVAIWRVISTELESDL